MQQICAASSCVGFFNWWAGAYATAVINAGDEAYCAAHAQACLCCDP
jgi:hypothetical protein